MSLMKKRPQVLVFEGVDGAGKSTIIQLLAQHLDAQGYRVKIHRTVGSTEYSQFVKQDFLQSPGKHGYIAEAFAMLATHADTYYQCLQCIDNKEEYDVVLIDRWYGSFYAYQLSQTEYNSVLRDSLKGTLIHYVGNYFFIKPDALLYIDVSTDTAHGRIRNRSEMDLYDQVSPLVIQRRLEQYESFLSDAKSHHWFERIIRIDNNSYLTQEHMDRLLNSIIPVALNKLDERPEEILAALNKDAEVKPSNWIRKTT